MLSFGDYFVADGASMLMIIKNEETGTYTIMANLQNTDESHEGYLIMVEDIEVEFYDETSEEEW